MSLALLFTYKARNLFGIRRERTLPQRSRKPHIGVGIVCGDIRMITPAGMSNELWEWLQDQGWREVTYRPDHRAYRQVSASFAMRLADAAEDMRTHVLEAAMRHAELRVCFRVDPDVLPAYVQRR